ncbi:MAG: hypothetical protein ACKO11_15365 [Cuspidothrix sp.]
MIHDHDHGHNSHTPVTFSRAFAIGTALNLGFVIVEAAYGYLAHSLALFADAGIAILFTHWLWLDPLVSLVVVVVIGTWQLLRDSINLALDGVPAGIEPRAVKNYLIERPGVLKIHDLHIWAMSTTETALTVHLVMPEGYPGDAFLWEVAQELEHHFGIKHSTIQVETGDSAYPCALEPDHLV